MKIAVDDPVVIIDRTTGQQNNTTLLRYDAEDNDHKVGVYYWPIDNPSNKQPLFRGSGVTPTGVLKTNPIRPGEIYIYRLQFLENPSDGVEVMVAGVWKDGASDFGIDDKGLKIGGTYADLHFHTRREVRGIYCEYGHQIWSTLPQTQLIAFPPGSSTFRPLNAIKSQSHQVTIQPLFPGNIYYFVLFLMDDKGRWQYDKEIFITKQRQLTISLKNIAIGQNSENSTLADQTQFFHSFSINSDEGLQEQIIALHTDNNYGDNVLLSIKRPIYLYQLKNSLFPIFLRQITFPLRAYTEDESVVCFTQAREDDWPASDDEASSLNLQQPDYIEFITGINETAVSSKSLGAINDDGQNPFDYSLNFDYYCTYQ